MLIHDREILDQGLIIKQIFLMFELIAVDRENAELVK